MLYGVILLIFSYFFVIPQNDHVADSVQTLHFHHSFEKFINEDRKIARGYLDSLFYISEQKKSPEATYYYHQDAGFYFFTAHDLQQSMENYKQALHSAKELHVPEKIIDSKIWIVQGGIFRFPHFQIVIAKS